MLPHKTTFWLVFGLNFAFISTTETCEDTFSTCQQHKHKYCKDSVGPVNAYEEKIRKRFRKNCRQSCGFCEDPKIVLKTASSHVRFLTDESDAEKQVSKQNSIQSLTITQMNNKLDTILTQLKHLTSMNSTKYSLFSQNWPDAEKPNFYWKLGKREFCVTTKRFYKPYRYLGLVFKNCGEHQTARKFDRREFDFHAKGKLLTFIDQWGHKNFCVSVGSMDQVVSLTECDVDNTDFRFDDVTGKIFVDKINGFCLDVERDHFHGFYRLVLQKCHENGQNGVFRGVNPLPYLRAEVSAP